MLSSSLRRATVLSSRAYTTAASTQQAWLYIDSIFPIQIARWDFRHYIGIFRQESLLNELQSRLDKLSSVHNFKVLELEPQRKDGGVFVRFSYSTPDSERPSLQALEAALRNEVAIGGSLPSWLGVRGGNLWLVKGTPWKEDMNRFASPILKLSFDGPDIQEQTLYEICRPYGRISDLRPPTVVPAGTPRSSTITFSQLHSATIARNVIHGLNVTSSNTKVRATYETPIQAHAVRDWMSSHPKIMLPLIAFLVGTLTYTIFDPIRSIMVEGKVLGWFDYKKFRLYEWLQINQHISAPSTSTEGVWKERKHAEGSINAYLSDMPATIAFIHGPQGSGKITMVQDVLKSTGRSVLTIDCRLLNNSTSDSDLVTALAMQTGYWPVFTFLHSMNTLVDLASVGLIGQKTGISSSLSDQLRQVLQVVSDGLQRVSSHHRSNIQRQIARDRQLHEQHVSSLERQDEILQGVWHDGRIDCVAGNGIMSELGVGIESFSAPRDGLTLLTDSKQEIVNESLKASEGREWLMLQRKTNEDLDAIKALPIVVIRNYAAMRGGASKDELLAALASWATQLVENQIAHVIILSDNRENARQITKALKTKPLVSIDLSDADSATSLSFVKQKLTNARIDIEISSKQSRSIERLGGRASDLESLVHKVRNGMGVEEAIDDIINRGVVELRQNAFGDDVDDAKGLTWTREQAWKVVKSLSQSSEMPYYDILVEFPFKGNEAALRNMEHAEIISIGTVNGRPSTIRPGKPVFRWVFERLVNDRVFNATQELGFNEKQIAEAESKIKGYQQELSSLAETMKNEPRPWWDWRRSSCHERFKHLGEKLASNERTVYVLERKNKELKRVIGRGDHVTQGNFVN